MTDTDQHEATPRAELERQIMDPNIPKNEREWWAVAEIERLQRACRGQAGLIAEIERHMREKVELAGLVMKERDDNERLRALLTDTVASMERGGFHVALQERIRAALEKKP